MTKNTGGADATQYWIIGGVLVATVLILGIGLWFVRPPAPVVTIADPSSLPGLQTTVAPWNEGFTDLKARLNAINFQALTAEGNALHIHQRLDVFVHGAPVIVPPHIGIDPEGKFISQLHSHDTSQVIHVESPTVQDFTLGQFFDVWGVKLTADCIGGYCASGDEKIRVFSDGEPYTGNPRELVLVSHQAIVVTFGTEAELPNPIPKSYTFPPGE